MENPNKPCTYTETIEHGKCNKPSVLTVNEDNACEEHAALLAELSGIDFIVPETKKDQK